MAKNTLHPKRDNFCKDVNCRKPIRPHNKSGYCTQCSLRLKPLIRKNILNIRKIPKDKKRCKAITHKGDRCKKPSMILGYCITHYTSILDGVKKQSEAHRTKKTNKDGTMYLKFKKDKKYG